MANDKKGAPTAPTAPKSSPANQLNVNKGMKNTSVAPDKNQGNRTMITAPKKGK